MEKMGSQLIGVGVVGGGAKEKMESQFIGAGVVGGGGGKRNPVAPPPPKGLLKQNSWSPDIERDEIWERRRRGSSSLRRVRSVTDDDLDELRGCIDLGFGFETTAGCAACGADRSRLVETLPALDLYYAVHGGSGGGGGVEGAVCSCGGASETSSEESPLGSPLVTPEDSPETVKMRLKQWAQVVALSMIHRR